MILNETPANKATLNGVMETNNFGVKATPKAYQILFSSLYSNKIRAILRELSCNAWDSHVAAGNQNTPFEIHLPTKLDPYFYIRDYGVGLDHDEIKNVYTVFFESTKTQSNDFIGALGLGSKTPFSYTTNFTITSIKHRIKRIYSAFINDDNIPCIVLMNTDENCDQPTGLEVRFNVNFGDMFVFIQEAENTLIHFPVKPIINQISLKDIKVLNKFTPSIKLIFNNDAYRASPSVAVMGYVEYAINSHNLVNHVDDDLLYLLNNTINFYFENGQLDFQPNREQLQYTPKTINSIRAKLIELKQKVSKYVNDEFDQCKTFWEKCIKLDQLRKSPIYTYLANQYNEAYLLNNPVSCYRKHKTSWIVSIPTSSDHKLYHVDIKSHLYNANCNTLGINRDKDIYKIDSNDKSFTATKINVKPSTLIVVNNQKNIRTLREKIKLYVSNLKENVEIWILTETKSTPTTRSLNQLIDDVFQGANIVYGDKLPQKPQEPRVNVKKTPNVELINSLGKQSVSSDVLNDTTTNRYYIKRGECSLSILNNKLMLLNRCLSNQYVQEIYMLNATQLKKIENKSNWITLSNYVDNRLKQLLTSDIDMYMQLQSDWFSVVYTELELVIKTLPPTHNLKQLSFMFTENKKASRTNVYNFFKTFNIPAEFIKTAYEKRTKLISCIQQYPLIELLLDHPSIKLKQNQRDLLIEHINTIDNTIVNNLEQQ